MLKQYRQCWKVVLVQLCLAWRYWIPAPQNRDQPIGAWSQHGLWHVTCQPRLVQLVASPPCVVNLLVPQYTSCHSQGTGHQTQRSQSNIATKQHQHHQPIIRICHKRQSEQIGFESALTLALLEQESKAAYSTPRKEMGQTFVAAAPSIGHRTLLYNAQSMCNWQLQERRCP